MEDEKEQFPRFGRDGINGSAFLLTQQYDEFGEVYESKLYLSDKTLERLKAELTNP